MRKGDAMSGFGKCGVCGKKFDGCGVRCALPADRCPNGGTRMEPVVFDPEEPELGRGTAFRFVGCRVASHFKHLRPVPEPEVEALNVRGRWEPFDVARTNRKKMRAFLELMWAETLAKEVA
jgi:hypothetical protein